MMPEHLHEALRAQHLVPEEEDVAFDLTSARYRRALSLVLDELRAPRRPMTLLNGGLPGKGERARPPLQGSPYREDDG